MKKGDIALVRFPFTDIMTDKLRPALALTDELDRGDWVFAFITSKLGRQGSFDIPVFPHERTGLKKDSLIRLGRMATLNRRIVLGKIGSFPEDRLSEVNRKLGLLLQL